MNKIKEFWINPKEETPCNPVYPQWHESYTENTTNCIHVVLKSDYDLLQAKLDKAVEHIEFLLTIPMDSVKTEALKFVVEIGKG